MLEKLPALVTSRRYKLFAKLFVFSSIALGALCTICYLASGAAALLVAAFFNFATAAVLLASMALVRRIEEYKRFLRFKLASLDRAATE